MQVFTARLEANDNMKYLRTLEDWFDKLNDDGDFPKLLEVRDVRYSIDAPISPPRFRHHLFDHRFCHPYGLAFCTLERRRGTTRKKSM